MLNFLRKRFFKKGAEMLLLLILSVYLCSYLKISSSIPVDGDGGFHASVVQKNALSERVLKFHPFVLIDGKDHLPLFYPKLFYTEMSILYIFLGEQVFKILVPSFGILIGFIIFLFSRSMLRNSTAAILPTVVTLSSYGLIINSVDMFRMETMVIFLGLASIYSLYRFTKAKEKGWFICSTLLFAACISTKQQAYIYLPLFFLVIINKFKGSIIEKIRVLCIFFISCFVIASPILLEEFLSTGTLFYPGVPFVGKIEAIIANFAGVKLYSVGEGWKTFAIGSDRGKYLQTMFSDIYSHLRFLDPFTANDQRRFSPLSAGLLLLGLLSLLKLRQYFIVFFLVIQQLLLFKFPLERYYLLNQIISAAAIGASTKFFGIFKLAVSKNIGVLLSAIIITLSIFSAAHTLNNSSQIPDFSYGNYRPGRLEAEIEAGNWVKNNTPSNSVLITPRAYLDSYYSQRDSLWLNQVGGEDIYEAFLRNDVESIHRIANRYDDAYIFIPEFWVTSGEAEGRWVSFIERATVERIESSPQYFQQVYSNDLVKVFQVNKR